jgi:hypothetical protein
MAPVPGTVFSSFFPCPGPFLPHSSKICAHNVIPARDAQFVAVTQYLLLCRGTERKGAGIVEVNLRPSREPLQSFPELGFALRSKHLAPLPGEQLVRRAVRPGRGGIAPDDYPVRSFKMKHHRRVDLVRFIRGEHHDPLRLPPSSPCARWVPRRSLTACSQDKEQDRNWRQLHFLFPMCQLTDGGPSLAPGLSEDAPGPTFDAIPCRAIQPRRRQSAARPKRSPSTAQTIPTPADISVSMSEWLIARNCPNDERIHAGPTASDCAPSTVPALADATGSGTLCSHHQRLNRRASCASQ